MPIRSTDFRKTSFTNLIQPCESVSLKRGACVLSNGAICVLLDTITELTITKSHLGKTTPYDLLKVHYCANGKMDSIAWYLTDPRAWKLRIEGLKAGTS